MDFLSLTFIFIKIITFTNGYVLLAANIDDFQTIAKKLGSQKFIDELVQMANEPEFEKYKPSNHRDRTRQDFTDQNSPTVRQREPKLSLKETGTKIDFEELVERVRQRLEKEFENKNHDDKGDDLKNQNDREIKKYTRNTKTTKWHNYYDRNERENVEPLKTDAIQYDEIGANPKNGDHDSNLPFKKIELTKDDSYDDYVTPAKDSSNESKDNRFKVKNNNVEIRPTVTLQTKRFKYRTKTTEETADYNEIKARTETLDYDDLHETNEKSGTGIPTRETYKMVTPNYYVSLPTVAERYDFNEPLPERDRERENVKYIGNPPARINKKIRLL